MDREMCFIACSPKQCQDCEKKWEHSSSQHGLFDFNSQWNFKSNTQSSFIFKASVVILICKIKNEWENKIHSLP